MEQEEIAKRIVQECFNLHKELGPGLLESVYELLLFDALTSSGLRVGRQKPIPIVSRGKYFEEGFKADLIVEDRVLVEMKSIQCLANVHKKVVLTYLRLSGIRLGILVNFGGELLKGNIERIICDPSTARSR